MHIASKYRFSIDEQSSNIESGHYSDLAIAGDYLMFQATRLVIDVYKQYAVPLMDGYFLSLLDYSPLTTITGGNILNYRPPHTIITGGARIESISCFP